MDSKMALNLIAEVMGWSETDGGTATEEFEWLRLMSQVKYDSYADFRAGVRFIESLANWLKQFEPADRPAAYDFVKTRLIYISPAELKRVVESFVPETMTPMLRRQVAAELSIRPYEVWSTREGVQAFETRLRRRSSAGIRRGPPARSRRRAGGRGPS